MGRNPAALARDNNVHDWSKIRMAVIHHPRAVLLHYAKIAARLYSFRRNFSNYVDSAHLRKMSDDGVSEAIRSTLNSVESLRSVVSTIPQLGNTSLKAQLQATTSLCISLQQHPGLLESESSKQVVNLLLRIGTYAVRVKKGIEATFLTGSVDWSTCPIEGRPISGIATYIQLLTSSVFIGAVDEAL